MIFGAEYGLDLSLLAVFLLLAAAFLAGFIDSVAGGGGLIALPALLLSGLPPHICLGNNKFMSSLGTAVALVNFSRSGLVLWRVALVGVGFSLLGSYAGSWAVMSFDGETAGKIIVALLPVGVAATFIPKKEKPELKQLCAWSLYFMVPFTSLAVGFYDGFFGPGTGSFFILAFHFILGLSLTRASATAKVFNLASNVGALAVFLWEGQVWLALGLPMALCNMAGNWLGSRLAIRRGSKIVRVFLGISLSLLFLSLALKYYFQ